jgi:hypothetical protein
MLHGVQGVGGDDLQIDHIPGNALNPFDRGDFLYRFQRTNNYFTHLIDFTSSTKC